jgi:hypothetical protein
MRPYAFYELAEWLLANRQEPAGYRSVISRRDQIPLGNNAR